MIEVDFIPSLLKGLDLTKSQDETLVRMSHLIGKIVYKLSTFDLHIKYQD